MFEMVGKVYNARRFVFFFVQSYKKAYLLGNKVRAKFWQFFETIILGLKARKALM